MKGMCHLRVFVEIISPSLCNSSQKCWKFPKYCLLRVYVPQNNIQFQYPVTWYKDNTASREMTTHYSNIFNNRNLHCDIQQLPRLNPTHQAEGSQRLAWSILSRKSHCVTEIKHTHIHVRVVNLTVDDRNHRHLQHCLQRSLKRNQLTDKHSHTQSYYTKILKVIHLLPEIPKQTG